MLSKLCSVPVPNNVESAHILLLSSELGRSLTSLRGLWQRLVRRLVLALLGCACRVTALGLWVAVWPIAQICCWMFSLKQPETLRSSRRDV
eukprot:3399536-Amphidinium_carterae.1